MTRIAKFVPVLLGALFLYAAIHKLLYPGAATMALESLDVPYALAKGLVTGVIILELYLGTILLLGLSLRFGLMLATGVMFAFAGYLWYLSTMASPPSCGCLGLTGIFENSRHEALFGLARNVFMLFLIKWTYDQHFPVRSAGSKTGEMDTVTIVAK